MGLLAKLSETLGFAASPPVPSGSRKRKDRDDSSEEERSFQAKRRRYSDGDYLSSPYDAPPSAPVVRPSELKSFPGPVQKLREASFAHSLLEGGRSPRIRSVAHPRKSLPTKEQVAYPEIAATPIKATTPSKVGTIRLNAIAAEPWATHGMSNEEKWVSKPNKRAFEIAANSSDPKRAVRLSVKEPEYALRDMEIRDGLFQLTDLLQEFVKAYFKFKISGKLSPSFFEQFEPETAKVIGCVASGGPGGVQGWHEMFTDQLKREMLVMAIMGNVLVEQVFQHIFFGGLPKHVEIMTELQKTHRDEDGFDRNKVYALGARTFMHSRLSDGIDLPANFANHVNRIVGTIYTHTKPILALNPASPKHETIIPALHTIVTHAGILSLSMRLDPHTVYHFVPVFKEDEFTSERMECLNHVQMQQTNPRTPDDAEGLTRAETQRRANLSPAEKNRAQNDDPLTQITILDGVTAYRQGGWEAQDSTLSNVKFEKQEFENRGVRVRKLTDALVYCRWGRARRFKSGKGDDVATQHGDAWKGGFVEFARVKGVGDWIEHERKMAKGKGKAMQATEDDLQAALAEESEV
ncbi:hypothetical protein HBH56_133060 [Parastagonospora nodorum]|uniref:Uncharacterized protein n=1 Tax=Phaeosphaeria nodorum (strain SN15 / ATCC MYA-4574 / FGSC 10173) TaxID=321614 RepID=A0A7U2I7S2_PHANO|nr:hypothetical protein HBH56_133060 [Parastagonospora nodorum]QRD02763.1 hypothetical protein JI435_114990 [Parastagonospora nodorum SN15]KAH3927024.1 hypothetical protein HBH54_160170 [Parastagonospora nodorum]KAH4120173.1 hypothetical protein HBH47_117190 [Parastagonospora nodorum]KAH4144334.1 hypothetical protein HBH45_025940 [Parastagonospora nodorum]